MANDTIKWTNVHGIDATVAQAIMNDDYEMTGDISATGLLNPPQIGYLTQQHQDEMVQDVSDHLWILLGRAVHYVLSRGTAAATLQEKRLTTEVLGWQVSGQFDVYYAGGAPLSSDGSQITALSEPAHLKDFKVTSVWSYIYGGRDSWRDQLNIYAYLARLNGIPVERLSAALILRDWNQKMAKQGGDYPPIPFVEIEYELWPMEVTRKFIEGRVMLHQAARSGGHVAPCTEADRWARPDTWALQKPGAKRAYRVFPSNFKAREFLDTLSQKAQSQYTLLLRPGQQIRCEDYCPVRQWCKQADDLGVPK